MANEKMQTGRRIEPVVGHPRLARMSDKPPRPKAIKGKILLMADEVLTSWARTGKFLCTEHWNVVPDVVAIGKGFGNGFPVTCVAVREPFKESFEQFSASSRDGGIQMACAASLSST